MKFNRSDRKIFIKKNVLSFFCVDACIRSVYCPVYWVTDRFAYEMSRMIIRIENIYIYRIEALRGNVLSTIPL